MDILDERQKASKLDTLSFCQTFWSSLASEKSAEGHSPASCAVYDDTGKMISNAGPKQRNTVPVTFTDNVTERREPCFVGYG